MTNEKNHEQTSDTAKPKSGSGKKVLFLALGLLLLAGAGVGWHFFSPRASADAPAPARPLAIVHLNNFIVNLADTDRDAYLKVGIDLGITKPAGKTEGDGGKSASTPEIRDTILSVLTTYHSADLLTSEGKTKLKRNLIDALRRKVPKLRVRKLYFTDFLVQR